MAEILLAGCGDVGTALGLRLAEAGHKVYGLRRNVTALPSAIHPIRASFDDLAGMVLPEVSHVVFCAAAKSSEEAVYRAVYVEGLRAVLAAVADHPVRRLVFTSSTAVYGKSDAPWIDETSPTEPERFSGRIMLEAEALVRAAPMTGISLRLGGIYGPGRTHLLRSVQGGLAYPESPPIYGNRIHRDDCAGLLEHLLFLPDPQDVYLGVDDAPAPMQEVASWMRRSLTDAGIAPAPPRTDAAAPYRAGKRCSNARVRGSGYVFQYPSYREGYPALVADYAAGLKAGR